MKTTLLEIVQSILSDMDSEEVNSISDSVEAQQIASVVEDVYFNIVSARNIPEHNSLVKLTSLVDTTRPTYFSYPENVSKLHTVEYNIGTTSKPNYKEIVFLEPYDFIKNMNENGLAVTAKSGNVSLYVSTDTPPSYYTSFDDYHIVMDSYDSSVESTLAEYKTRAFGKTLPTFSIQDGFVPDLDKTIMPLLLAEAKSACFSLFKGGPDPKVEQAARRLKSYVQNDQHRTKRANTRTNYGR